MACSEIFDGGNAEDLLRSGRFHKEMVYMRNSIASRTFLPGAAFLGAFVVDWCTKWLVVNVIMAPPRIIEVAPFFSLTLGFNRGVSFGLLTDAFADRPLLLAGMTGLITIGLIIWAFTTSNPLEAAALGAVSGGAAGNIYDRAVHGAVTDFLDFHIGAWHWPTFNMADIAITLGVALLLMSALKPIPPSKVHP